MFVCMHVCGFVCVYVSVWASVFSKFNMSIISHESYWKNVNIDLKKEKEKCFMRTIFHNLQTS